MTSEYQKHIYNLRIAMTVATMSKDPDRKVGALIVSADKRHSHLSYNGFPPSFPDTPENWEKTQKHAFVIHAEENGLVRCPFPFAGTTLYVTCKPCQRCLRLVVTAGIKRVVYLEPPIAYKKAVETSSCDYEALLTQVEEFIGIPLHEIMAGFYESLLEIAIHDGYEVSNIGSDK